LREGNNGAALPVPPRAVTTCDDGRSLPSGLPLAADACREAGNDRGGAINGRQFRAAVLSCASERASPGVRSAHRI